MLPMEPIMEWAREKTKKSENEHEKHLRKAVVFLELLGYPYLLAKSPNFISMLNLFSLNIISF